MSQFMQDSVSFLFKELQNSHTLRNVPQTRIMVDDVKFNSGCPSPAKWLCNQGHGSPLASNQIRVWLNCTRMHMYSEWRVVWKCILFVFLHFQLPDKCHNICVTFLVNFFIEFTTYVVKKVTIVHKGSVKMDEYYSMFWALYYSNGRSSCYAGSMIHH